MQTYTRPIQRFAIYSILLAGINLLATSCADNRDAEYKRTLFVFGTLIEITLFDTTESDADAAFDHLERRFHAYHASWTPWEKSDLSDINAAFRAGRSVTGTPDVVPLIAISSELYASSKGLFNPAIGNLINLWQMHRHDEPGISPPAASDIAELVRQDPTMSDVSIQGMTLSSRNPGVQLSLGAFAKGYAIDLAMQYLQSQGIHHAVINAGGDLSVIGQRGQRPWRIGVRHPRENDVLAWLEAEDGESVFTSGDYERYYFHDGERYHHILDPRTGYPAHGTASATVIHHDAGLADAAATALFVAGPDHWFEIARSMGIKYVMLVDTEGQIHLNPAMQRRIHLTNPKTSHIVLSEPL